MTKRSWHARGIMEASSAPTGLAFSVSLIVTISLVGMYSLVVPQVPANQGINTTTTAIPSLVTTTSYVPPTTSVTFGQYGYKYLGSAAGCASGPGSTGPWTPVACWGSQSDAVIFNCAREALSQQGCTQTVSIQNTTNGSYGVRVWYPYANKTITNQWPWANCAYTFNLAITSATHARGYAYCISTNSTSFEVTQPVYPP